MKSAPAEAAGINLQSKKFSQTLRLVLKSLMDLVLRLKKQDQYIVLLGSSNY